MKIEEFKLNMKVSDAWFKDWGIGIVIKILKTRVYIKFPNKNKIYDMPHLIFLKQYDKGNE